MRSGIFLLLCIPFISVTGTAYSQIDPKTGTGWVNGYYIGPGENLSRADLSRANLAGANLAGANLTSANLTDADLTGADLSGVTGNSVADNLFAVMAGKDATITSLQVQIAALEVDLVVRDGQVSDLEAEKTILEAQLAVLQVVADAKEAEVADLSAQVVSLQVQVAALEVDLVVRDGQVSDLEAEKTVLEAQLAVLQVQLSTLYSLEEIVDLRPGSTLFGITNGWATLRLVIQESDDLVEWKDTTGTSSVTLSATNSTKKFFRFSSEN